MKDEKVFDFFKSMDEAIEFSHTSGGKCCPFNNMQLCVFRCGLAQEGYIHYDDYEGKGWQYKAYRLECCLTKIGR